MRKQETKRKSELSNNIVNFKDIDLTRINHILDVNNAYVHVDVLVKTAIDIASQMSYSEDFENLTGLKR